MQSVRVGQFGLFLCWCAVWIWCGCSSSQTSNTARTSTEQLLISNAIDQALDKVNFTTFTGSKVFLQEKYIDSVDKNYLVASVRHRLLTAGAVLVDSVDDSEVVVEVRSGAVGTTGSESFIGFPEFGIPGMLALPEVRLAERKRQHGIAKIGIVAYDPKTGAALGQGGVSLARAEDNNWFIGGMGPVQTGSLRGEISRSTTGSARRVPHRLPPVVAFEPPYRAAEQFVDGTQDDDDDVSRVSHEP